MRYLTHPFAHSETLDRARRWLVDAGVSPDRIQVSRHGVPRLAVTAEPGEVNGIEMVIRAAEMADPDGLPGFWDLTRIRPDGAGASESGLVADLPGHSASFALAWHPVDASDDGELRGEVERQRDFREMRP